MDVNLIRNLGIAIGLGLLIGLQREWSRGKEAGIRTFTLITLLGALCAHVSVILSAPWIIAGGLLAVTGLFLTRSRSVRTPEHATPGLTTDAAALVMFIVGTIVTLGYIPAAIVTTGAVAALLHSKKTMLSLVSRLGEDDLRALVRLIVIGMVILPILPNKAYDTHGVLNPFHIWVMVVLIVGISMSAYIARLLLGARVGLLLAGILGGLISSTATTAAYARRTRHSRDETGIAMIVIMISSTVVFARVIIEIAIIAPNLLREVAPPLLLMMSFMALLSLGGYLTSRKDVEIAEIGPPPSDLGAAVIFGLLYAAVLFAVATAKEHFGHAGMYTVAGLSGLTDMDAITLSSAQLMKTNALDTAVGWRLILVGAMANLVFKLITVAILAHRRLLLKLIPLIGISIAAGIAIIFLWP